MNWPQSRRRGYTLHVSASQLAQMGVCEKLVVFEHRFGKHPSRSQWLALERGRRAHERPLRQASPNLRDALSSVVSWNITRIVQASLRRCVQWCRVAWRRLARACRDR